MLGLPEIDGRWKLPLRQKWGGGGQEEATINHKVHHRHLPTLLFHNMYLSSFNNLVVNCLYSLIFFFFLMPRIALPKSSNPDHNYWKDRGVSAPKGVPSLKGRAMVQDRVNPVFGIWQWAKWPHVAGLCAMLTFPNSFPSNLSCILSPPPSQRNSLVLGAHHCVCLDTS